MEDDDCPLFVADEGGGATAFEVDELLADED